MTSAIIVGSGPNGLAAALTLANAGVEVTVLEADAHPGGGTRTSERTIPGLLHDDCAAVHPMGAASPFVRDEELLKHGLTWRYADIDAAHPLDNGDAGLLYRSIAETAAGMGVDGPTWQSFIGRYSRVVDQLTSDFFRPLLRVPGHPISLTRFGLNALAPATLTARRFKTEVARALFAGVAAHALYPLTRPTTTAVGLLMLAAGHSYGWPVAEGGSQAITAAMIKLLNERGGKVHTGVRVRRLADLPPADIVMFDLSPTSVADIAGDSLPPRVARAYRRWRYGPAAFKLDLAIEGGIPWTNHQSRRAGTVHLGGPLEEVVATEQSIYRGQMPERPFVLVGQQYLADPTRSVGDTHPVWAYAHVPNGYTGDATDAILAQIERFAPGTRERIVASFTRTTSEMVRYNPNYVGGDIIGGLNSPQQILLRPRPALTPYSIGIPGMYICSASTPPGGGVHGMCGVNAATAALAHID